jgi:hypothetical protein
MHFAKCKKTDESKEDEMGEICSTHGGDEKTYRIVVDNVKGRGH